MGTRKSWGGGAWLRGMITVSEGFACGADAREEPRFQPPFFTSIAEMESRKIHFTIRQELLKC